MMSMKDGEEDAALSKGARNKKCLYCDRKFMKAEHLRRHQRSHTGERPFQCKYCLKEYARSDVLMRHVRNHHLHVESEQDIDSKSSEKSVLQDQATVTPGVSQTVAKLGGTDQAMPKQPVKQAPQAQVAFKRPTPTESITSVPHQPTMGLDYSMTTPDMRQSPQDLGRTNMMYGAMPRPLQKQVDIPTYQFLQTETRMAPEPFNNIHPWLDGYTQDFPSVPSNPSMWDDLPHLEIMGINQGYYPSPTASRAMQPSPPKDNISDERYAKIASLWPSRKKPARRLIQTLWRDIANYEADNIYCEVDDGPDETIPTTEDPVRGESRWGFDNERRARLIDDCRPLQKGLSDKTSIDRRISTDTRSDSGSSSQDVQSFGTKFPSTQILDISIDLYFRRFHPLMPLIHEPTFTAKKTSSTLLFPLCLFGLTLLDSARAKKFVNAQLPDAIERCRKDLVLSSRREGQLGELLTAIASSMLLLALAAVSSQHGAAEYTRLLYNETMAIADRHGLFVPQQGEELSAAIFQNFSGDDVVWKAWARVESVKRLIVTLIMTDSFYSHLEGHSPRIHPELLHFYFPCKTELFQATNGRRWSQMISAGAATIMPWLTPQLESTILPPPADASAIGFFGLFSTIWVRIGEARYRFNLATPENTGLLIPAEVFVNDSQAASIIPLILQVWQHYGETIGGINPNCEAFWHHLCLAVTADLGIFELAAGRGGADSAKSALEKIITWSSSAAARRACVHAAQTFFIMSKRSVNSGTSFEAEISLVLSALVLGLYVFVMPQYVVPNPRQEVEAFELLDRVNWNLVGEDGFAQHPLPEASTTCPARTWIREGGPITFSGVLLHGGYYSARRVLLDYVYLLEDVGKWNVAEFCHILRIMSDALIDLDPA